MVERSGMPDLTLAKMSDVRGVVKPHWVDAFVCDKSPTTWLEEPVGGSGDGGPGGHEEEEAMEVPREEGAYDRSLMQSFIVDTGRELERRQARGSGASATSTESPTAALAKLAVRHDDSVVLSPGDPPARPESPASTSERGTGSRVLSDASAFLVSEQQTSVPAQAGPPLTSTPTPNQPRENGLDSAIQANLKELEKTPKLLLEATPPPKGPQAAPRACKPLMDSPIPILATAYPALISSGSRPPLPPSKKRDLHARNAPLVPPPPPTGSQEQGPPN